MSLIDKHVDVQIAKETATVSRVGFGTPAILTYHTVFPQVYRLFGGLDEMVTAGFATTDLAYKMAAATFAQSPRPTQVVVGRRGTPHIRKVKLTPKPNPLASTDYTITINGIAYTVTTDATPTVAEITDGFANVTTGELNTGSENVLGTDNTTDFTIEAADAPGGTPTAGVPFVIEYDRDQFFFSDDTVDVNIATELANLQAGNDDWYGLVADAWGADEIEALATAIESAGPKIYIAETQDTDVVGPSSADIASILQTAALDRTAIIFNNDLDPSPASAWLGSGLPTTPGSITWKFRTLSTVSASALLTGGIANADGKNANTYTETGGINITAEGVMSSGEFIDVTRFIDWLTARIKENVFRALAINPKIPFTNSGIQAIVAEVEGVLRQGIFNGGINPDEDLIVTAPLASEVDANDRASRILPDISFIATLAGAIHKTVIRGKVVA
jgi:hypothetical protein